MNEQYRWIDLFDEMRNKLQEKDSCELAIYAAELVLPYYEKNCPRDSRPKNTIEAIKEYLINPTDENRKKVLETWKSKLEIPNLSGTKYDVISHSPEEISRLLAAWFTSGYMAQKMWDAYDAVKIISNMVRIVADPKFDNIDKKEALLSLVVKDAKIIWKKNGLEAGFLKLVSKWMEDRVKN